MSAPSGPAPQPQRLSREDKTRGPLKIARDGHSFLEEALYWHLWKTGGGTPEDSSVDVSLGYNKIARQLHVTDKTVKRNLYAITNEASKGGAE